MAVAAISLPPCTAQAKARYLTVLLKGLMMLLSISDPDEIRFRYAQHFRHQGMQARIEPSAGEGGTGFSGHRKCDYGSRSSVNP